MKRIILVNYPYSEIPHNDVHNTGNRFPHMNLGAIDHGHDDQKKKPQLLISSYYTNDRY